MRIAELEQALLAAFPVEDAEAWDHVGLSVGEPAEEVTGVSCALDATEENVHTAHERGHNVLLTHHPIYIKAPSSFTPADSSRPQCAAALYAAARLGVSVISLHTNLDRSHAARNLLPELCGLKALSSLEHVDDPTRTGLGALCADGDLSLQQLASVAAEAFDSSPRVWGDSDAEAHRVAFLGGSLGEFGELALAAGADAIVCGECGYHVAQDLAIRGLGVVLLGHDRSEEPFVDILAKAAVSAGVGPAAIDIIESRKQWWTVYKGVRS